MATKAMYLSVTNQPLLSSPATTKPRQVKFFTVRCSAGASSTGAAVTDDVDTRAITRRLREDGSLIGVLSTEKSKTDEELLKMSRTWDIVGVDLISNVSCEKPYEWVAKTGLEWDFNSNQRNGETFHVVAYDFGIKHNILRRLASYGCITVVQSTWPASETLKMKPDGVLFSNGPGDPSAVPYAVETVKEIIGKVPIFGICMGHQLLGQALGGKTYKMKFGHHGGNHPVRNLRNGSVEISAQRCRNRCLHFPIVNELGNQSDQSSKQGDKSDDLGVKVALSMLRFYKREISPLIPRSCRYVPTCSEYSMIAYSKYGVVKGSILTAWRLCRCNPLGGSGFDPPRWFDEPSPPEE